MVHRYSAIYFILVLEKSFLVCMGVPKGSRQRNVENDTKEYTSNKIK